MFQKQSLMSLESPRFSVSTFFFVKPIKDSDKNNLSVLVNITFFNYKK